MAYSPTTPCSGSIPFTGELKDGLVLVIATVSEDSGSEEFVSSVFYKNKWHNTQACHTGIVLTSVEVKDGKINFTGQTNYNWDYAIVFQTDGFQTT